MCFKFLYEIFLEYISVTDVKINNSKDNQNNAMQHNALHIRVQREYGNKVWFVECSVLN